MSDKTQEEPQTGSSRAFLLTDARSLVQGLMNAGVGVWRWTVATEELNWTENVEPIHNLPVGSFDGTLESFSRDIHGEDAPAVWQAIHRSLEVGEPYRVTYRAAGGRPDGPLWIEACGGLVLDEEGRKVLTGVCIDATERVIARRELERRLMQQKAISAFGHDALETADLQKVLEQAVQIAANVLDAPLSKILKLADSADHLILRAGIGWREGLVGSASVDATRDSHAGYTLLHNEPVIVPDFDSETRFGGHSLLNEHGARSGMSVIIAGGDERSFGVFSVHTTEPRIFDAADAEFLQALANIVASAARQAAAADQKELLVREMAHRAGNMLQFVSSIATQTFGNGADPEIARRAFSERLSSLARANYLIAKGGWTQTRLRAVLGEVLQPFVDRVILEGRDILLLPELCFDLGLILHELASNSVKYGVLAELDGKVHLDWSIGKGTGPGSSMLTMHWRDAFDAGHVPTPLRPGKDRAGFGSRLIASLVERKWNGRLSVSKDPEYHMAFAIPLP